MKEIFQSISAKVGEEPCCEWVTVLNYCCILVIITLLWHHRPAHNKKHLENMYISFQIWFTNQIVSDIGSTNQIV